MRYLRMFENRFQREIGDNHGPLCPYASHFQSNTHEPIGGLRTAMVDYQANYKLIRIRSTDILYRISIRMLNFCSTAVINESMSTCSCFSACLCHCRLVSLYSQRCSWMSYMQARSLCEDEKERALHFDWSRWYREASCRKKSKRLVIEGQTKLTGRVIMERRQYGGTDWWYKQFRGGLCGVKTRWRYLLHSGYNLLLFGSGIRSISLYTCGHVFKFLVLSDVGLKRMSVVLEYSTFFRCSW